MAQSQYRVHSPFLFEMYRQVLFAELDASVRQRLRSMLSHEMSTLAEVAPHRERGYHDMVLKLIDHYHLSIVCYDADEAVLRGDPETFGTLKVVCRPHRNHFRELRWMAQCRNNKYNISIDMYDVGVLLSHPKLHPQHLLLK